MNILDSIPNVLLHWLILDWHWVWAIPVFILLCWIVGYLFTVRTYYMDKDGNAYVKHGVWGNKENIEEHLKNEHGIEINERESK